MLAILMLVVVGMTALNIYQDHVIHRQQYELRWLLTHSVIRPDVPASAAANNVPGAVQGSQSKAPTATVAAVPPSSKPSAPAPSAKH